MNAVAEKPEEIRLPGSIMAQSVAQADDETLKDCLEADLRHIKVTLEPEGVTPTKDGLAPDEVSVR